MRRRSFFSLAGGGLVALVGAGTLVWNQVPVIPKRPNPDARTALGWISHRDGRYRLVLPRAEMGQNIATALKQVACAELDVDWDAVAVELHDTGAPRVKASVGSESVMLFAEPLAQACAALREAIARGHEQGVVDVEQRPRAALRSLRKGGLIGVSAPLEQGREIVTGQALYAADIHRPGLLHGRVLRAPASTELASYPRRWNPEAVRELPGFVAVVEACGPPIGKAIGLGIVAKRPGALDRIAEGLAVEWEIATRPVAFEHEDLVDIDRELAKGDLPHAVTNGEPVQDGPFDVDLRMDIPLMAHAGIEPRAAVAEWRDDILSVWAGTQDAFYIRDHLADGLGLSADKVRVQSCRVGGAFGGRTLCTVEAEAAALARATGAPVKVQWTRAQEFALGFHRPPSSHRIRARLAEGRITDWDHGQVSSHILFTSAALPAWMQKGTDALVGDGGVARGMAAPYRLGRARSAYQLRRLPVHTGPWRGLGAGPNGLAVESAMDEAALRSGADPLAFRLAHVADPVLAAVLTRVGAIARWGEPATAMAGARTGRGIACGIYKEKSYAAVVADVAVRQDGTVLVTGLWCVHECGLVINPDQVRAQCEGNLVWSLGLVMSDTLPIAEGRVVAENFSDCPIPAIGEVPMMWIETIDSDRASAGAGETVMVAGPGSIANAIRAATGIRVRRFPLRVEDLAA